MEHRISVTELARRLADVLDRVRTQGDSFVVEVEGDAVARLVPPFERRATSLREALAAWHSGGEPETGFAVDLEQVGAADRPPQDPSAS